MKLHKTSLACAITLIFTISISISHATGFTVDLIHRDSLKSPSLHSSFQSVAATLHRSFHRAETLIPAYSSPHSASADIVPDTGEYLLKFAIGTPRVETLAIADTGSDLTWIQCAPCRHCFKQKAPIFVPSRSSTYKPVSCHSAACSSVHSTSCGGGGSTCTYSVAYGDRSYSRGDVATETITLGSNASLPRVIIGCGHVDQGTFGGGTSGIVGLGGGRESLIRQMGASIGGKFSYCLVPLAARARKASKMHFGGDAVVSGSGVVKTPIVAKSPDTFYYLTLEGMSVGKQRFDLASSNDDGAEAKYSEEGNIIIDSGTTLTFLPSDLYRQVETALRRQVKLREISDPQQELRLCYLATGDAARKIPEITAHFRGADVKLKPYNTFIMTSQRSLCFAFTESTSLAIYGNLAQMNFLIGYDLEKRTVSFKPTDCSHA